MSASELSGLDREFDSLFRSQVRELESESLKTSTPRKLRQEPSSTPSRFMRAQRPVREIESEATPVRALPKFKRTLVESRRAMRNANRAASSSFAVALSARIPMTVLVATVQ